MTRPFALGIFIIFFLANLVQCFAQKTFTLSHPSSGTYPNCTGGITCTLTQACVAFSETWTLDRNTIFADELVSGTYQNTYFSACPFPPGDNTTIDEQIVLFDFTSPFAAGMWYGDDGPCPHTLNTNGQASIGIQTCAAAGFPDTINFQFQLDAGHDAGLSDPQTMPVEATSFALDEHSLPVFSVSYMPDQSAELGPCTQCQEQAGAPINVITGNTWIQQQDYLLPGLGGGIDLTRIWNSTWSNNRPPKQVGMFGDGWTSTYEESLSQSSSGLKYWSGAGTAWTFSFNSSTGTYTLSSPSDARGTLTFDSTLNQYTVTLNGARRIFDSNGLLLKLLDRNANTTNLIYDSSGRLSTVTDAAGRTLSFVYADPSNLNQVTAISDAAGTIATYTYAPNGVLSSVIYADGSGFNFTSDASNLITNMGRPRRENH